MRHDERRPEEIQADIERTRDRMEHTLSAIESRMSPGQLLDHGLDYVRESGGAEFFTNLGNAVKNNPLPVAMMGVSVAWLMASAKGANAPDYSRAYVVGEGPEQTLGERAGSAAQRTADAAAGARERISAGLTSAKDRFSDTATRARDAMGRSSESARRQAERVRGGFERMLHEQPLALGAIGLALGAMFAASLPRSRTEDEMMGSASDQLMDEAKEAAKAQLEKGKAVAEAAASAARDEAERQGIAGSEELQGSSASPGEPPRGSGSDAVENARVASRG